MGKNIEFCNIVPTAFINDERFRCSSKHLLLSYLIRFENRYCDSYRLLADKGDTLYLDNNFFEKNVCATMSELVVNAELVGAKYIILPDLVFEDKGQFSSGLKRMIGYIPVNGPKVAVVLTGKSIERVFECFDFLNECTEVQMVCIPDRLLMNHLNMMRSELLDKLEQRFTIKKGVHLLALDNISELPKLVRPYVVSIDSTIAFRSGYYKVAFPDNTDTNRPQFYFDIDKLDDEQCRIIIHNLDYVKKILNGG